jgi:hypothetical protein
MKTEISPSTVFPQGNYTPSRIDCGEEFVLTSVEEKNIDILCEVARSNGDVLSLQDLIGLASLRTDEKELQDALLRSKFLSEKYIVADGAIIAPKYHSNQNFLRKKGDRRARALYNTNSGRGFSSFFNRDKYLRLMSISGSTSYLSAAEGDDLDFFCITSDNYLWIFIAKALLLARIYRLRNEKAPVFCFSYVLAESRARDNFRSQRDGLQARDTLSAIVLHGEDYYRDLLRGNPWLSTFFPLKYEQRLRGTTPNHMAGDSKISSPKREQVHSKILNFFLYVIVGNYIRTKSYLTNKRLKSSYGGRIFRAVIEKDRHVFESDSYLELRRVYASYEKNRVIN